MKWVQSWEKCKKWFQARFFQFEENEVFEKTTENVRKPRDIKLVTTEARRNYLILELNNHTTKFYWEKSLAIEKKTPQIFMNEPVYLALSI